MQKDFSMKIEECIGEFFLMNHLVLERLLSKKYAIICCGSTKLGMETGFAYSKGKKLPRIIDCYSSILSKVPVVGISYSGNSTEVTDLIPLHTLASSVLITRNKSLKEPHVLHLLCEEIPQRYLPLLSHKLGQHFLKIQGIESKHRYESDFTFDELFHVLNKCYSSNRIPIFFSDSDSWFARIFSEQYMECLKRPSFWASYPGFTHNLLWTLNRDNVNNFFFIHEASAYTYSDSRSQKTLAHIECLGGVQEVLRPDIKGCDLYLLFSLCLEIYNCIANHNGIDMNSEYSFSSNLS